MGGASELRKKGGFGGGGAGVNTSSQPLLLPSIGAKGYTVTGWR